MCSRMQSSLPMHHFDSEQQTILFADRVKYAAWKSTAGGASIEQICQHSRQ